MEDENNPNPNPDANNPDGGKPSEGEKKPQENAGEPSKKPNDTEAELLRDVMKFKDKYRTVQEEADKLKSEFSEFKSALGDLDVDAIKSLAEEQANREKADLEKKGEYDRIVEQMREKNKEKEESYKTQIQELTQKLSEATGQIDDLTIGRQFSDSVFLREESALPPSIARTTFGKHFEMKDGALVGYDKPAGATERTPLVDDSGNPLGFDDAIKALYSGHPESKTLFKSKMKPGANSKDPNQGGGKPADTTATGVNRIAASLGARK